MRKASIAEWILSLATTPERAAATVGDLIEKPSSFWFSVFGTFVSLVIDGLVSSPAWVIGWTVLVIFAEFAFPLLNFWLILLFRPWAPTLHELEIGFCFWLVAIGHESARFLRERVLAVFFVLAIFNGIFILLIVVLTVGTVRLQPSILVSAVAELAYLAGAVLFRHRSLHKHA